MEPGQWQVWKAKRITSRDVMIEVKVGKGKTLSDFGSDISLRVKKVTIWIEDNVLHLPKEQ